MKPYGVKSKDNDCCPGHNKISSETYNNRRSKKAKRRDTKYAHGRERSAVKTKLKTTQDE